MLKRSDVRHTCFRMKNKQVPTESNAYIVEMVEKSLPVWATWANFCSDWDIFIDQSGTIKIIKPELDYDFCHSTCLEAALYKRKNLEFDFGDRESNVLNIVELNMMENMTWENYNKTWGISVDHELKRIHTRHFLTKENVVTPEMIKNSAKSDGAPQLEVPSIPVVQMHSKTITEDMLTPVERKLLEKYKAKK